MKKVLLIAMIFVAMLATMACSHTHTAASEMIVVKEATCFEEGSGHILCIECGETLNTIAIPKTYEHLEVTIPAVNATCESTGLTEGKKCSVCDKIIVSQQETPLKSHTYDDKYDDTCNECGHVRDAECAHIETEVIEGKDETCTSTGLTDGSKCKRCGEILVSQEVIPIKAHTEVIDEAVQATCSSTGLTEGKHCSVCDEILVEQSSVPMLEHSYISEVTPPTTTASGYARYTCSVCGDSYGKILTLTELSITKDNRSMIGYTGIQNEELVIPEVFENNGTWYKVTSISSEAFKKCTNLVSVTIPDTVRSISWWAFFGCTNLVDVIIPASVKTIGSSAFGECWSLTNIIVDADNSYYTSIEGNLYSKDETTLIQYAAGKADTSFIVPNTVTHIGEYAFDGCKNLLNITIGNSVTDIGEYAFRWCTRLTKISIPDSVTSLGEFAFYECYNLASATIGNGVTSIGDHTFNYCTKLTSVTIGRNVTSIGDYAFFDCMKLTNITIPTSVTAIGDSAFCGCDNLVTIKYNGTKAQWGFISLGNGWVFATDVAQVTCSNGTVSLK